MKIDNFVLKGVYFFDMCSAYLKYTIYTCNNVYARKFKLVNESFKYIKLFTSVSTINLTRRKYSWITNKGVKQ